ncbi:MAG: glycoside hydrolase family 130 protein [Actinomycetes bacterium]
MPSIPVQKNASNPIIRVSDVQPSARELQVDCVFNPAATKYRDQVVLLVRVAESPKGSEPSRPSVVYMAGDELVVETLDRPALEAQGWDFSDSRSVRAPGPKGYLVAKYLTSISHLRLARSADGVHFKVDDAPFISPTGEYESWGCEDPRITLVGDRYMINYSSVSPRGICTTLVSTTDFESIDRHGVMFAPENRNVGIFGEQVHGKYYAVNRPAPQMFGEPAIWLAESPDLVHWGNQRFLMGTSASGWESGRVGAAFPPVRTAEGWLFVYHAADPDNRYCLGAMLLDLDQPWVIKAKLAEPILQPTEPYETDGFFSNVVFSCGAVVDGDTLHIYYGVADTEIALADLSVSQLVDALLAERP